MKKILLVNRGLSDNFGDQAIKFTLEHLYKNNKYEVEFQDFREIKKQTNDYINGKWKENYGGLKILSFFYLKFDFIIWLFRFIKKTNLIQTKKYSICSIGGGQLIQKNTFFPLAMYIWTKKMRKNVKQIIIFGCGCSNNYKKLDHFLYRKSFEKMDKIFLRDEKSRINLKEKFNLNSNKTIDPVFCISDFYTVPEVSNSRNIIGIAIMNYNEFKLFNSSVSQEEYLSFCIEKIEELQKEYKMVYLFYTTVGDSNWSKYLLSKYSKCYQKSEKIKILHSNTLEEFLNNLKYFDTIYSSRMHALIIGISYGKKCISHIVSDKMRGFNDEFINKKINLNSLKFQINSDVSNALEV